MNDSGPDPYTSLAASVQSPPKTWKARLRYLGPSVVVSGSIIGSGELILTSSLGAAAGFVLLWWLLLACWSKSLVQAELARYVMVSSAVAGFGGLVRLLPDYLIEFGRLERRHLKIRQTWVRSFGAVAPFAGFGCYLLFESPIVLLSIGALAGSILLPLQSGSTLWLHKTRVSPQLRPAGWVRLVLWLIFLMQALLALLIMLYVIF